MDTDYRNRRPKKKPQRRGEKISRGKAGIRAEQHGEATKN